MKLAAGESFDRYTIEAFLGEGGMGQVYRALDPRLARRIALKILVTEGVPSEGGTDARARLLREARAAAALDHPNVVAVFDVGEVDAQPFLAMELVEGATLRDYIGDSAISMRRRERWLIETARALAAAHRRGLVHRDVKPENVMVRTDGTIKVLDFGIARRVSMDEQTRKSLSTITREGELVGTLLYMAPEQLHGHPADARSDQFAWGVIAFELVAGAHPFAHHANATAIVGAILESKPPDLGSYADVPVRLMAAIERALQKSPDARFPTMDALLEEIEGESPLPFAARRTGAPTLPMALATTTPRPVTLSPSTPRPDGLEVGRVLCDRYEIVRMLGRGGMGEVYEAIDRARGARVALKTLRADRAKDTRAVERFRREVELARRVSHPNVARVFDLDTDEGDPRDPVVFLTRELLDGETLAERIARDGRFTTQAALPLARAMGDALAAAHAAGVVHRDFKSANVLLVPDPRGGAERVVVTDFGLARDTARSPMAASLTRDAELLGTPEYMAPEQVTGAQATAASDVYALGIVLFELVTGRLPFVGETRMATAMMRLSQPAPSPRELVPSLPAHWESAILRCLSREPADRFAGPDAVIAALEADEPRPAKGRASRRIAMVALALAAAAIAGGAIEARRSRAVASGDTAADAAASTARLGVVVVPLHDVAGDARMAWLGAAIAEMLRSELAAGETLRVIPGGATTRALRDLDLRDTRDLPADAVKRLGTGLDADVLVDGAFVSIDGAAGRRVRVDLCLKNGAGEVKARVAESGTDEELFDVVGRAARALRAALGVAQPENAGNLPSRATMPSRRAASRPYIEGVERLREMDPSSARAKLEETIGIDPQFPLAHAALAEALSSLGYASRAREEAKRAMEGAAGLPREQALSIEARYLESAYQWSKAADAYRVLSGFFPDDVEYGVALARVEVRAGEPKKALETVERLRALPSGAAGDPRIDLVASEAAGVISDVPSQLRYATAAFDKARARGSRSLEAEAALALANTKLRRQQGGKALVEEMERIEQLFLAIGNRGGAAQAIVLRATALRQTAEWDAAGRELARALALADELEYRVLEGRIYTQQAILDVRSNPEAGIRRAQMAVELARSTGDRALECLALNALGSLYWRQDKLEPAQRELRAAAEVAASIGARQEEAAALDNVAMALESLGQMRESLAMHEQMAARFREMGTRGREAITLHHEAGILTRMGRLDAARTALDQATQAAREVEDLESLAIIRTRRALLESLAGQADRARALLRESIDEQRRNGAKVLPRIWEWRLVAIDLDQGIAATDRIKTYLADDKDDPEAIGMYAYSLALDGHLADALVQARAAVAAAPKMEEFESRTDGLIYAARVLSRAGRDGEAIAILRPLVDEAARRGDLLGELDARIALHTSEAKTPADREAARAALANVESTARTHGLIALADRAVAARL